MPLNKKQKKTTEPKMIKIIDTFNKSIGKFARWLTVEYTNCFSAEA